MYIPEDSSLLRDVREPACSKLGVPSALECTSEDEIAPGRDCQLNGLACPLDESDRDYGALDRLGSSFGMSDIGSHVRSVYRKGIRFSAVMIALMISFGEHSLLRHQHAPALQAASEMDSTSCIDRTMTLTFGNLDFIIQVASMPLKDRHADIHQYDIRSVLFDSLDGI